MLCLNVFSRDSRGDTAWVPSSTKSPYSEVKFLTRVSWDLSWFYCWKTVHLMESESVLTNFSYPPWGSFPVPQVSRWVLVYQGAHWRLHVVKDSPCRRGSGRKLFISRTFIIIGVLSVICIHHYPLEATLDDGLCHCYCEYITHTHVIICCLSNVHTRKLLSIFHDKSGASGLIILSRSPMHPQRIRIWDRVSLDLKLITTVPALLPWTTAQQSAALGTVLLTTGIS